MGKLYRRGNTWWADYRDEANERHRVSLYTHDREVARVRLRERELGKNHAGEARGSTPKTLESAVEQMIALKRDSTGNIYKFHALQLYLFFGIDRDINTLTRADVGEYITKRLKVDKVKRHTVQKELVVLRGALREAQTREEYAGTLDIVPSFKADYEPRRRWLTIAEFNALLEAVKEHRRTWLMIQVYTGAELSAMKRLGWEHVNLAAGTISIPGTKNSARYRASIPIHPHLQAWLESCDKKQPLIQPWPNVAHDLQRACLVAKIEPVSTHDLRRTFGSWLVQAGVDIHHVARLMGNSPAMVAKVYGQTSDASYAAAINRLPSASTPPPVDGAGNGNGNGSKRPAVTPATHGRPKRAKSNGD